jgi:hypothetical protein
MDAAKSIRRNPHNPYLHRPPEVETPEVPDPLYIRMPRCPNHCPYTSLARSTLDLLVRPQEMNDFNPPVKSKLMRQTGGRPKIRLINYRSLKEYLDSLPDGNRLKKAPLSPKAPQREASHTP